MFFHGRKSIFLQFISGLFKTIFLQANMYFLLNYDMMEGNKKNREKDE